MSAAGQVQRFVARGVRGNTKRDTRGSLHLAVHRGDLYVCLPKPQRVNKLGPSGQHLFGALPFVPTLR